MRQVSLTKIFTFDAAHHLNDYSGPCSRIHGHTYKLEVTVTGPLVSDMIMDFFDIKSLVEDKVISLVDHRYLNEVVSFNPTVENMAVWMVKILEPLFAGPVKLQKVRLWENQSAYAEVIL